MRAITMSSLSAVACLLVLTCPLVSGAAHGGVNDVIPVRDSQFYWGLHPHDNVTVGQGGKVVFRTAVGYHDIAVVPTSEEYDACDVSNAETWVNPTGEVMVNGAGEVEKSEFFYEFTYNADTPGTYYIVCTIAEGSHCRTGQKLVLTVTDTPSTDSVNVMGSAVPFWTVGVQYEDMTIMQGESVRFVSDTEGYHDVALVDPTLCGAFNQYECCAPGSMQGNITEFLYKPDEFKNNAEYIWSPSEPGTYEVVCSIFNGNHCMFGQRFMLTVTEAADGGSGSDDGSDGSDAVQLIRSSMLASLLMLVAVLLA